MNQGEWGLIQFKELWFYKEIEHIIDKNSKKEH